MQVWNIDDYSDEDTEIHEYLGNDNFFDVPCSLFTCKKFSTCNKLISEPKDIKDKRKCIKYKHFNSTD